MRKKILKLFAPEENPDLLRAGMNSGKKTSSLGKTPVERSEKMLFKKLPWNIIGMVLVWKIMVIVIFLSAFVLLPFKTSNFTSNFTYPKNQKITIETSLKTWDAQHYLYLAKVGYKKNQVSNWFYPLYPLTIKIFTFFTHSYFYSAIILSNLYSLIAILFFYFFCKNLFGEEIAFVSILLLLSFPTAFFLNIVYSESLFLLLSLSFFYYLYKEKFLTASLLAFFLPLTRSVGAFIVIPFVVFIIIKKYKGINLSIPTFNLPIRFNLNPKYLYLLFPLLGYAFNFLYMYIATGDPFAQFAALKYFIGGYSVLNVFNIQLFFHNLFGTHLVLHGFTNSLLDRLFFAFFIVMLPFVYKKTDKVMFSFYILLGFVPILGSFMGYMRFLKALSTSLGYGDFP